MYKLTFETESKAIADKLLSVLSSGFGAEGAAVRVELSAGPSDALTEALESERRAARSEQLLTWAADDSRCCTTCKHVNVDNFSEPCNTCIRGEEDRALNVWSHVGWEKCDG